MPPGECAYVTSGGPLVTTRAGPVGLAQGAAQRVWAARGCGTRLAAGRAYYTRYRGRSRGRTRPAKAPMEHWPSTAQCVLPLRQDVRCCAAANCPQRVYRLNLRPVRARRLSKAGRHWAPITRQRATRKERHSGLTWPTYCNKPNSEPPVIDGMVRTVAAPNAAVKPKTVSCADVFREGP